MLQWYWNYGVKTKLLTIEGGGDIISIDTFIICFYYMTSTFLSEKDALLYLTQQSLEHKIVKINALFAVLWDIKYDLLQDIVSLWKVVLQPTDEYCETIVKTLYALIWSLHWQDDTAKYQLAEQIQWKLATLHQQEAEEKIQDDTIADTLLEDL